MSRTMARPSSLGASLALLLVCASAGHAAHVTAGDDPDLVTGPVIGILSLPNFQCDSMRSNMPPEQQSMATGANGEVEAAGGSCFTWFYTKWLEQAGARTAVIRYDEPEERLQELFESVNGILFTGGGLSLEFNTTYMQSAKYLYDQVVKEGVTPLWGTCMGFQTLSLLTSQDQNVLERAAFDSEDISMALDTQPGAETSRFAQGVGAEAWTMLTTANVTSNLHHDGVPPAKFFASKRLTDFYQLISTNVDRKGKAFTSTMEGKTAPVYGTQWHPERPQFEWTSGMNINHTAGAIRSMQAAANFFVDQARLSKHAFPTPEAEQDAMMYQYPIMGQGAASYRYYVFPPATAQQF